MISTFSLSKSSALSPSSLFNQPPRCYASRGPTTHFIKIIEVDTYKLLPFFLPVNLSTYAPIFTSIPPDSDNPVSGFGPKANPSSTFLIDCLPLASGSFSPLIYSSFSYVFQLLLSTGSFLSSHKNAEVSPTLKEISTKSHHIAAFPASSFPLKPSFEKQVCTFSFCSLPPHSLLCVQAPALTLCSNCSGKGYQASGRLNQAAI